MNDKLKGILGITGTLRFKINWNADPTISGLYVFAYLPPRVTCPDGMSAAAKIMFLTGCPHVLVNVAHDTSAVLEIPYVGETSYIPYTPADSQAYLAKQLGNLVLFPISPVRSAVSGTKVGYRLYFAFKDTKTFGTSALPGVLQASAALGMLAESVKKSKVVSSGLGSTSEWLNNLKPKSKIGNAFTKAAGWLVGGASTIANFLGWSKPTSVVALQPVCQLPMSDTLTADQTFSGNKFANNTTAGLSSIDLSGRGVDEHLFQNFCRSEYIITKKPATAVTVANGSILVSKTDTPGTLLGGYDFNYASWRLEEVVTNGAGPQTIRQGNHFWYLNNLHKFWRGSHILKVIPVCTKFHSARIRVVYTPYSPNNAPDEAKVYENQALTYSWVIDISDPSSWEIHVPFVSPTPFIPNWGSAGRVSFYLENYLIAPDNVPPEIVLCSFAAPGPDLEFAFPTILNFDQYSNPKRGIPWTTSTISGWLSNLVPFEDDTIVNDLNVVDDTFQPPPPPPEIGVLEADEVFEFIPPTTKSTTAHQMAVGDPVRSILSEIKRAYVAYRKQTGASRFITFDPRINIYGDVKDASKTWLPDLLMMYAPNFAFCRGGVRLIGQNVQPCRVTHHSSVYVKNRDEAAQPTGFCEINPDPTIRYPMGQTFSLGVLDPLKIEIPYYQFTQCINMWKRPGYEGIYNESNVLIDYYQGVDNYEFSRAAADDFQFGFLVGAPALRLEAAPSIIPTPSE